MTNKHFIHQTTAVRGRTLALTYDLCLYALAAILLSAVHASANILTFTGKAVDESGQLQYLERHSVRYADGDVIESKTVYLDESNRKIGDLISDYEQGSQYGSYIFRDLRANYKDGARVETDRIMVFRKSDPQEPLKKNALQRTANQIVGQGFNHFISENLEAIMAGQILHVRLVLPSRLNQYDFRIRGLKVENDTAYVRLEIDNWFLRLLAPHVDAEYCAITGRLLRYEGISNLTDGSGKHKKVVITYDYEFTGDS
jgi:hypothetical protein